MSTSATIALFNENPYINGELSSDDLNLFTILNYDGYPDRILPILDDFFSSEDTSDELFFIDGSVMSGENQGIRGIDDDGEVEHYDDGKRYPKTSVPVSDLHFGSYQYYGVIDEAGFIQWGAYQNDEFIDGENFQNSTVEEGVQLKSIIKSIIEEDVSGEDTITKTGYLEMLKDDVYTAANKLTELMGLIDDNYTKDMLMKNIKELTDLIDDVDEDDLA